MNLTKKSLPWIYGSRTTASDVYLKCTRRPNLGTRFIRLHVPGAHRNSSLELTGITYRMFSAVT